MPFLYFQQALNALKERLKSEQVQAVQDMQEKCQKQSDKQIQELNEKHKKEIEEMEEKIEKEKKVQKDLLVEIENEMEVKAKLSRRLKMVVNSFQSFINTTKGFEEGQSDFLIPDIDALGE